MITLETPLMRRILIAVSIFFVILFLFLPLATVFYGALRDGFAAYKDALVDEETLSAIKLTLILVVFVVPINIVFGVAAAWLLARFNFFGRSFLIALFELPFTVSPVVSGLVFVLLFGVHSVVGKFLVDHGIHVIFAMPGIVIATLFVTVPYVARGLIPLLEAQGADQEEAALTLGAKGWRTFFSVTLPNMKWGLLYSAILLNARAMGEFGAVSVVSGHIRGETNTIPLHIEILYNEYNFTAAFVVSSLLALLTFATIAVKGWVERNNGVENEA